MIVETYPNPNKPKQTLTPFTGQYTGQRTYESKIGLNGRNENYNKIWAAKKGLSVEEFVRRDKILADATRGLIFYKNQVVYPADYTEFHTHGQCRVLQIIRDYADWDWEWKEGGPFYVVEACSEKNKFSIFRGTPKYFQTFAPFKPSDWTEPKPETPEVKE